MIVVDSSVWIDYFNGNSTDEANLLNLKLGQIQIITGDLMLVEVLQGFKTEKDFRQARQLFMSLGIVNMVSTQIALKSAKNFRELRKRGVTIRKTIDTIIATWCIENNLPLLHSDKDFQPFHDHLNLKSL